MNCLTNINTFLDDDFNSCFELPAFIDDDEGVDKEDVIGSFKYCFEEHYKNGDMCLCGFVEPLCNTKNVIEMSVYLADRYNEEEQEINNSRSRSQNIMDEIIHEYVYYYLKETKYPMFIQQIENYWINNNNLPPAQ